MLDFKTEPNFYNYMVLFNLAWAEEAGKTSNITSFMPLILITLVFYFLVIRPQQKKQRSHQAKLKDLAKGDEIITTGGIIGKVVKVPTDSDNIVIEIAKDVEIKVHKLYIADFLPKLEKESKKTSKKEKANEKED